MLICCDLILRGKFNFNACLSAKTPTPDEDVGLSYLLCSETTQRDLKYEHSNDYNVTMLC